MENTAATPAAPAAAPTPAPVAPATPAPNTMADGGSTGGGSVMETLKGLNWMEVGFGILGSATLYYAIYYYRYNINQRKQFEKDFQNKIDELNIKIADVTSVMNKQQEQKTNDVVFF